MYIIYTHTYIIVLPLNFREMEMSEKFVEYLIG